MGSPCGGFKQCGDGEGVPVWLVVMVHFVRLAFDATVRRSCTTTRLDGVVKRLRLHLAGNTGIGRLAEEPILYHGERGRLSQLPRLQLLPMALSDGFFW